jgi:hypothetical protein
LGSSPFVVNVRASTVYPSLAILDFKLVTLTNKVTGVMGQWMTTTTTTTTPTSTTATVTTTTTATSTASATSTSTTSTSELASKVTFAFNATSQTLSLVPVGSSSFNTSIFGSSVSFLITVLDDRFDGSLDCDVISYDNVVACGSRYTFTLNTLQYVSCPPFVSNPAGSTTAFSQAVYWNEPYIAHRPLELVSDVQYGDVRPNVGTQVTYDIKQQSALQPLSSRVLCEFFVCFLNLNGYVCLNLSFVIFFIINF